MRVGLAIAVAGAGAAVVSTLPSAHRRPDTFRPGKPQVARTPPSVPLTPARRRAVNALLDAFVPAAVERRHPAQALSLVTPAFRAGQTRADWARGNLPVHPFDARDERFHGWRLDYSYPNEISVDLLLQPAAKEKLGAISFTAVLRRTRGRWLIDSFVPAAIFAPEQKVPRILAQPDFAPNPAPRGGSRLSSQWLLVPLGLLALVVLVPIGVGVAHLRRSRRAWRRYRSATLAAPRD